MNSLHAVFCRLVLLPFFIVGSLETKKAEADATETIPQTDESQNQVLKERYEELQEKCSELERQLEEVKQGTQPIEEKHVVEDMIKVETVETQHAAQSSSDNKVNLKQQ